MSAHYCIANPCFICNPQIIPEYKFRFFNEFDNEYLLCQKLDLISYKSNLDKNASNGSYGTISNRDE